ncbi:hypothetical protein QAD02_010524 [Eretmocerus hayati]|uniref:Uncharacterized protein n=1 Tax=Eretmocerus hayati TaxID=131215 RepID=A0ACC2NU68_9HYME|nr:hypothetical protein QAD02_010524 [Eretmocerus hayati]
MLEPADFWTIKTPITPIESFWSEFDSPFKMKFLLTVCFALTLALASQAIPLAPENESHVGESYDQSGSDADATTASSPEDDTIEEPNSNEVSRERRILGLILAAKFMEGFANGLSGGSSSSTTHEPIQESYEGDPAGFDGYSARG